MSTYVGKPRLTGHAVVGARCECGARPPEKDPTRARYNRWRAAHLVDVRMEKTS